MNTIEIVAKNSQSCIPMHQIVMLRRVGAQIVVHLSTGEQHNTVFDSEESATQAYLDLRKAINAARIQPPCEVCT